MTTKPSTMPKTQPREKRPLAGSIHWQSAPVLENYRQTQPAEVLAKSRLRRRSQTPSPEAPPASSCVAERSDDPRRESVLLATRSAGCDPKQPAPVPSCAARSFSPPGASSTPHRRAGWRSLPRRHRRTPFRAPATFASRSTTPRDEKTAAPSVFSAPDWSSHPNVASERVRAKEFAGVLTEKVPAAAIAE